MPRAGLLSFAIGSLFVAVCLSVGAARETTGEPWTPAPTQTPWVRDIVRYVDVLITPTPEPTPYTEHTYRQAQRVGTIPLPPTPRPTAIVDASGQMQVR